MATVASKVWNPPIPREINQGFGPPAIDWETAKKWYKYAEEYCSVAGYHIGLDIDMDRGTPLFALTNGVVMQTGMSDSFRPNPVWIQSDNGYVEIYGHMWEDTVKTGDRVKAGDHIGFSGEQTVKGTMEPDGSGPHLHFELRIPNASCGQGYEAVDPTQYLTTNGADAGPLKSGSGSTSTSTSGSASSLLSTLGDLGQRSIFVIGGTIVILFGLYALYRASGGASVSKIGKSVVKFTPQGKALSAAGVV